jgi:DNA-binding CsgD family transcriptional regulator
MENCAMKDWDLVIKEILEKNKPGATYNFIPRPEQANKSKAENSAKKTENKKEKKRYPLGEKFPNVMLSQREAACVLETLKGKTMTKIASSLKLSPRTVEYYMGMVRQKTGSINKSDLIEKILNSDFVKNAGKQIIS